MNLEFANTTNENYENKIAFVQLEQMLIPIDDYRVRPIDRTHVENLKKDIHRNGFASDMGFITVTVLAKDNDKTTDDIDRSKIFDLGPTLKPEYKATVIDGAHRVTALKELMGENEISLPNGKVAVSFLFRKDNKEITSLQYVKYGFTRNSQAGIVKKDKFFCDYFHGVCAFVRAYAGGGETGKVSFEQTNMRDLGVAMHQSIDVLNHLTPDRCYRMASLAITLERFPGLVQKMVDYYEGKDDKEKSIIGFTHLSRTYFKDNVQNIEEAWLSLECVIAYMNRETAFGSKKKRNKFNDVIFYAQMSKMLDMLREKMADYKPDSSLDLFLKMNVNIAGRSCIIRDVVTRSMSEVPIERLEAATTRRAGDLEMETINRVKLAIDTAFEVVQIDSDESLSPRHHSKQAKARGKRKKGKKTLISGSSSEEESDVEVVRPRGRRKKVVIDNSSSSEDENRARGESDSEIEEEVEVHEEPVEGTGEDSGDEDERNEPMDIDEPAASSPQIELPSAGRNDTPQNSSAQAPQQKDPPTAVTEESIGKQQCKPPNNEEVHPSNLQGEKEEEKEKEKETEESQGGSENGENLRFDDDVPESVPAGVTPRSEIRQRHISSPDWVKMLMFNPDVLSNVLPSDKAEILNPALKALHIEEKHRAGVFLSSEDIIYMHQSLWKQAAFVEHQKRLHNSATPVKQAGGYTLPPWSDTVFLIAKAELDAQGFCILRNLGDYTNCDFPRVEGFDKPGDHFDKPIEEVFKHYLGTYETERKSGSKSGLWSTIVNKGESEGDKENREKGVGRFSSTRKLLVEVTEKKEETVWAAKKRALLDVWIGLILAGMGMINVPGQPQKWIPASGGRFLLTSKDCPRQASHNDFDFRNHSPNDSPGYFCIVNGEDPFPLWVIPGSQKLLKYSDDERKKLRDILKLEKIVVPESSIFIGHGHLTHAGAGWEDRVVGDKNTIRYHSYIRPEKQKLTDQVFYLLGGATGYFLDDTENGSVSLRTESQKRRHTESDVDMDRPSKSRKTTSASVSLPSAVPQNTSERAESSKSNPEPLSDEGSPARINPLDDFDEECDVDYEEDDD